MGEKTKKSIRILIIIAAITGIMVMGVADSRGLSKTEYMYATVGDERINAFWSDGKVYFSLLLPCFCTFWVHLYIKNNFCLSR